MQFIRAPDENVYIAPLNLIEIVISGLTEWWMPKKWYEILNDWVMAIFYSPLLFVAAFFETRTAHYIRSNRARGEDDDDVLQEWEQMESEMDFETDGWAKTCDTVKPNLDVEPAILEINKLHDEMDELKAMLSAISKSVGAGAGSAEADGKAKKDEDGQQGGGPSEST